MTRKEAVAKLTETLKKAVAAHEANAAKLVKSKVEKCGEIDKAEKCAKCKDGKCPACVKKTETKPTIDKPNPGAVMPDDKAPKKIDAEGSGGEIKKFLAEPSLGSLAPVPSLGELAAGALKHAPAQAPVKVGASADVGKPDIKALDSGGKEKAFIRKPAADDVVHLPKELADKGDAANLAGDKKAAGVGFLNSLVTKFKGIGNSLWHQTASSPSLGRAILAMSTRMARGEKSMEKVVKPASPSVGAAGAAPMAKEAIPPGDPRRKQNLPSMEGYKSIASNPTAMPHGSESVAPLKPGTVLNLRSVAKPGSK
jgi:hypothetical protein